MREIGAVTRWGQEGAPVWVCVAMRDALVAMRAQAVTAAQDGLRAILDA